MSVRESVLQDQIRLALGSAPDLWLARNNIGVAEIRGFKVRFGVGGPGGSDLVGIFRSSSGTGRFVAVEIKTETGRQTEEQRIFQKLVESKGGVYVILRSVAQANAWLEEMRRAG